NELSRKSKKEKLNNNELEEQAKLRKEYIKSFRKSFKSRLDNITVVDNKEEYDRLIKEQNKNKKN
ncbi:MAG: DUF896 domain-containing protein, partial [Bacillota bacterium]|nr:DUF896 domain-containing protein [Bacillota bacterium]